MWPCQRQAAPALQRRLCVFCVLKHDIVLFARKDAGFWRQHLQLMRLLTSFGVLLYCCTRHLSEFTRHRVHRDSQSTVDVCASSVVLFSCRSHLSILIHYLVFMLHTAAAVRICAYAQTEGSLQDPRASCRQREKTSGGSRRQQQWQQESQGVLLLIIINRQTNSSSAGACTSAAGLLAVGLGTGRDRGQDQPFAGDGAMGGGAFLSQRVEVNIGARIKYRLLSHSNKKGRLNRFAGK